MSMHKACTVLSERPQSCTSLQVGAKIVGGKKLHNLRQLEPHVQFISSCILAKLWILLRESLQIKKYIYLCI